MKTKLHSHSPVRKSPRLLSSNPSSLIQHKPKYKSNNAWTLSLDVIDPQPLKICHPQQHSFSPRRSRKFTINPYKTPMQAIKNVSEKKQKFKELTALGVSSVRMSPRLSVMSLRNGKKVYSQSKKRSCSETGIRKTDLALPENVELSGRCLRSGRKSVTKKVSCDLLSVKKRVTKKRLSKHESETLKLVVFALAEKRVEKEKYSLIDKCLSIREKRSCNVEKNSEMELDSNVKRGVENGEREVVSEKCLRSRKIQLKVNVDKTREKKSRLIVWNGSMDEKSALVREKRTCNVEKNSEMELDSDVMPEVKRGVENVEREVVSEKCLRSRKIQLKVNVDKTREKKSRLIVWNGSMDDKSAPVREKRTCNVEKNSEMELDSDVMPEVKRGVENGEREVVSEKCLRSRKIQLKVNVDKTREKKSRLIVWNGSMDEKSAKKLGKDEKKQRKIVCCFVGEPVQEEEAHQRWGWRYELKNQRNAQRRKKDDDEDEIILNVDNHYSQARVGSSVINIGDCVYVKGEGSKKHVGKILEFFKTIDGEDYFRVQWFYRAEDTVLEDTASFHDKRRLFYSTVTNDNLLDCIISKVHIVKIQPEHCLKSKPIGSAAFYYDMEYCLEYTTFRTLVTETSKDDHDSFFSIPRDSDNRTSSPLPLALLPSESSEPELKLLDIYSGCGGMSTGLCFGAKLSGLTLVTKWAVDFDGSACDSLRLNHPETQVRNEAAEDFLALLKHWENLCNKYVIDLERTLNCDFVEVEDITQLDIEDSSEEYEISHLVTICYGDPNHTGKTGLHFLVRWKGYGPDEDTWEPIEGLRNCEERIQEFVRKGFLSKLLPLPGDVDIICGGPPCQGISGYNRHRNFESPLEDERNRQLIIFMDIIKFLKPKYVLMENVVDIIKFDKASLGRYALSRLVHMKYQARLGIMSSGCYGVSQFRLRVFIWGAHPSVKLPQFPLPTHDVIVRYWPPPQFEQNIVAYDEGQPRTLKEAIILSDSISDLPPVTNNEAREEMEYEKDPETEFQRYIRTSKNELMGVLSPEDTQRTKPILYDHRPRQMPENDYLRTCQIPHQKGANFRNLPGIVVGEDNVAHRDPTIEPLTLPTGALLVPDCALAFEQGKSKRPFGRLWWDETVSTVVTYPHVVAQVMLHPEQDRVLTIRECARLQGFPDFYRFCGTVKARYRQVGNAVSVPVAKALGYSLGMAYQNAVGDEPLVVLPPNFST